jgi:hypothetical protein
MGTTDVATQPAHLWRLSVSIQTSPTKLQIGANAMIGTEANVIPPILPPHGARLVNSPGVSGWANPIGVRVCPLVSDWVGYGSVYEDIQVNSTPIPGDRAQRSR